MDPIRSASGATTALPQPTSKAPEQPQREDAPQDRFTPSDSADTGDQADQLRELAMKSGHSNVKGLISVGSSKDTAPAKPTAFSTHARNNFDKVDGDHDGYLSNSEIDKAMQDSSIKGDDAASIATLKSQRGKLESMSDDELGPETNGVSRKDLDALDRLGEKGDRDAGDVNGTYEYGKAKIAAASRDLFANGKPDSKALVQGNIGDCYFVSALAGKADADPESVKKMVDDNMDGSYTVHLGRGDVKVDAPTDAEIGYYGGSGKDGLWGSVIEKAYGKQRNDDAWISSDAPTDAADGGARLHEGVNAVTGHDTDVDFLSATRLSATRDKMEKATSEHRVVTASIRGNVPLAGNRRDNGLPMGHAYTVMGYDRKSDEVTLRNPWGSTEPVGADGLPLDGNNDGIFKMQMADFDKNFSMVAYEEAK